MKREKKPQPPYGRMAFRNPYNITLMWAVGILSLFTLNWWLFVVGAGAEILWITLAPDSLLLRRLAWDPAFLEERRALTEDKIKQMMSELNDERYTKCQKLRLDCKNLLELSRNNPSFTSDLLQEELEKVSTLCSLYVELAATSNRYQSYLRRVDLPTIEQEMRRLEADLRGSTGDIARKRLEILGRRKEKLREISEYITKAEGQMELIECTFQLLADQVVSLQSPHELGNQLDDLIDGVEAVRDASRERDMLLQTEAA